MKGFLMIAAVVFLLAGCGHEPPDQDTLAIRPTQQQMSATHGEYAVTPPPY
jgi:uncharacterized lipoprotein YajG